MEPRQSQPGFELLPPPPVEAVSMPQPLETAGYRPNVQQIAPIEVSPQAITGERTAQPPVSAPAPVAPQPTATATQVASSGVLPMPLVAADDDVIEKEWVEKVTDTIKRTKGDPYSQEREVKKIQIEYLKQRFGRTIGTTND